MIRAVVVAAGLGTRLRPLTERYAKPVLPVAGAPVLAHVLREIEAAGIRDVTIVVGHLADQVMDLAGDGSGFGLAVSYARQESPDGSAHAVAAAGATPPYLVLGADIVFTAGDVARFVGAYVESGASGALAVRPLPGTVEVRGGKVERVLGEGLLGMPLWGVGHGIAGHVDALPGEAPFELATAFQRAIDAGEPVAGIEIGPTRGLTTPFDLLEHNFPYLSSL